MRQKSIGEGDERAVRQLCEVSGFQELSRLAADNEEEKETKGKRGEDRKVKDRMASINAHLCVAYTALQCNVTHCSPVLSMPTEIALVTSTSSCPIIILRNMSVVAMACLGEEG